RERFRQNDIKLDLAFIHILGSRDKPYTAVFVGVHDLDRLQPGSGWRFEDEKVFGRSVSMNKARVFAAVYRDPKVVLRVVGPDTVDIGFKLVLGKQIEFHSVVGGENPEGNAGKCRV